MKKNVFSALTLRRFGTKIFVMKRRPFLFECFAITHIGHCREKNEDNFYIGEFLSVDEQASMSQTQCDSFSKGIISGKTGNIVIAVSDGMGGHKFGEMASFITVKSLDAFANAHKRRSWRQETKQQSFISDFQKMIAKTNKDINDFARRKSAVNNMGATLSGIIMFRDEAVAFNIGDSSTFSFEDSTLRKLTTDDNEATMYMDAQAGKPVTDGKRLTKYIGLPESAGILTATISEPLRLRSDQIYLAVTDGLTDGLDEARISQIVTENNHCVESAATKLLYAALDAKNGGRDNITIAMVKIVQ